jgi:hypothetical protein
MTTDAQKRLPSFRIRQPSASKRPCLAGLGKRQFRHAELNIFRSVESAEVLTNNFVRIVPFDALCTWIPGSYIAGSVQLKNRIIDDSLDQPAVSSLALTKFVVSLLTFCDVARYLCKADHLTLLVANRINDD